MSQLIVFKIAASSQSEIIVVCMCYMVIDFLVLLPEIDLYAMIRNVHFVYFARLQQRELLHLVGVCIWLSKKYAAKYLR